MVERTDAGRAGLLSGEGNRSLADRAKRYSLDYRHSRYEPTLNFPDCCRMEVAMQTVGLLCSGKIKGNYRPCSSSRRANYRGYTLGRRRMGDFRGNGTRY